MSLTNLVAIARTSEARYPATAPFHPDEAYPEYPHERSLVGPRNEAYRAVRESFRLLGLDAANYGTPRWNPLGAIVSPGQRVVIKPNFVIHANQAKGGGPLEPVVTHPSMLRAVIDYVLVALAGSGSITVADAPQSDCRIDVLKAAMQVEETIGWCAAHAGQVAVAFVDVREIVYRWNAEKGFLDKDDRVLQSGDPKGYVDLDLGTLSALEGLDGLDRLYGADYDRSETITAHKARSHKYRISRTMLDCDVFIHVPKFKVHRKVGITVNLKGLVGINGNKNYIVHHRIGSPAKGGDEYPAEAPAGDQTLFATQRFLVDRLLPRKTKVGDALYQGLLGAYRKFVKPWWKPSQGSIRGGDWWGNDTAWRMMIDLSIALMYADTDGKVHDRPQRRLFSVVDGIVGGQGEGPLRPDAHESRVVLAGVDPYVVDAVCCRLMGLDFRRLRWLEAAVRGWELPLWPDGVQDVAVATDEPAWRDLPRSVGDSYLAYTTPVGWRPVFPWANVTDRVSLNDWLRAIRGTSPRLARRTSDRR